MLKRATRLLPVSATVMTPVASIAIADGSSSCAGPLPRLAIVRAGRPVPRAKTKIRERR